MKGIVPEMNLGDYNNSMMWENGLAKTDEWTDMQCDIDVTKCYQARINPVINEISHTEGWITGGAFVTIKGHGFAQSDSRVGTTVQIGETWCRVIELTDTELSC